MKPNRDSARRLGEFLVPALVLGFLLFYSYVRFYVVTYVGFQYNGNTGVVLDVHPGENDPQALHVGDQILFVNGSPWDEITSPHTVNPLATVLPGQAVMLKVEGEQGVRDVRWVAPGINSTEFLSRFLNTWLMAYVFWLAGTATLLLVRPKDQRWALLVAFNFVTALWLTAGNNSSSGLFEAPGVLRLAIWASVPIYVHLQWNFPRPLGRLPNGFWPTLYVAAGLAATLQWIGWLNWDIHLVFFGIAVATCVLILFLRFVFRRIERREIGLLFVAALVALLPAGAIAISSVENDLSLTLPGYLLSMLALPGAYFYIVYRRQLGGLEFRANRLISLYLFLVLLVTFSLLIFPLISTVFSGLSEAGGAVVLTAVVTSLVSIFGFARFQRFVERVLLSIPEPPQQLLEKFAGRISTSLSRTNLHSLLKDEVLPTLLIRQSVLVDFEHGISPGSAISQYGVQPTNLPSLELLKELDSPMVIVEPLDAPLNWVRARLPLEVDGSLRGVWLLGRKDPDDMYTQSELSLLQSIADQMAIALVNISQANSLRALHQADIERQEIERIHLARELHDDTLRRIRELSDGVDDALYAKGFGERVEALISQVRSLINGLRPPMLDQGLFFALQDLAIEMQKKPTGSPLVHFEVNNDAPPFDRMVEQHIYRIIQQACENAIQHSGADHVFLRGNIGSSGVDLLVEDNGKGFTLAPDGSLVEFLSTRHFGLAGMQERASMIGAQLDIDTKPSQGTRVRLTWKTA